MSILRFNRPVQTNSRTDNGGNTAPDLSGTYGTSLPARALSRSGIVAALIAGPAVIAATTMNWPQGALPEAGGTALSILLAVITACLAALAIERFGVNSRTRRLAEVVGVMSRMAERQTVGHIPSLSDPDVVGDIARAVAVFRDETEEVDLRGAELDEMHARLDAALNHMVHGLLMLDRERRVVLCNAQYRALFHLDPDIVRPGATLAQVLAHSVAVGNHPGRNLADVLQDTETRLASGEHVETQRYLPDGRRLGVSCQPTADGGWVCTYEDITARETAAARMAHMARHDQRTGLPNRDALGEALSTLLNEPAAQPFNLLCIDVDRFDAICDTRGHAVADALLCDVADRLSNAMRDSDELAHLGGASFAVTQSGLAASGETAADAGRAMAQRLAAVLADPYELNGRRMVISVSIGLACALPPFAMTPDELLRNAGLALHQARNEGGGTFHMFDAKLDQAAQARQALELDLRAALAADQFELFYQPLVSVARRRVSGFEALLRWRHPTRGMVSPAVFIPLAEELGLIGTIGAWVLRTACREAATWPSPGGQDVSVAVNLSPLQFGLPGLVETVAEALHDSGLPGHRLELEITESLQLQEDAATLSILHSLRSLGARISLDDFGTGYSSLSYLRSFPFDKIKIDQSFVRSLPASDSAAIVRAIAGLGRSLNIITLAEGVETPEQLNALVAEGLQEMQGYLFSRPCPASDIPALIAETPARLMVAA